MSEELAPDVLPRHQGHKLLGASAGAQVYLHDAHPAGLTMAELRRCNKNWILPEHPRCKSVLLPVEAIHQVSSSAHAPHQHCRLCSI